MRELSLRPLLGSMLLIALGCQDVACQLVAGLDEPLTEPTDAGSAPPAATSDAGSEGGAPDGGGGSAYAAAVLADRPLTYYRFDETSGTTAKDSSGRGKDAFFVGAAERDAEPVIDGDGRAVTLGGTARLPLDVSLDFSFNVSSTYEIWLRPTDADNPTGGVFTNLEGDGNAGTLEGVALYFNSTSPFVGYERWQNELVRFGHALARPTAGPRGAYHIVVVNEGDAAFLWINGVRFGGNTGSRASYLPRSIVVGDIPGRYDELAVYDAALPEARIQEHYRIGRGGD